MHEMEECGQSPPRISTQPVDQNKHQAGRHQPHPRAQGSCEAGRWSLPRPAQLLVLAVRQALYAGWHRCVARRAGQRERIHGCCGMAQSHVHIVEAKCILLLLFYYYYYYYYPKFTQAITFTFYYYYYCYRHQYYQYCFECSTAIITTTTTLLLLLTPLILLLPLLLLLLPLLLQLLLLLLLPLLL